MLKAWLKEEFSTRHGIMANVGRVLMLIGCTILVLNVGWWVMFGVLLMFWGNNLGMVTGIHASVTMMLDAIGKELDKKADL